MEGVLSNGDELLTVLNNDDTENVLHNRLKETLEEIYTLREQQVKLIKDSLTALIEEEEGIADEMTKAKEFEENIRKEEKSTETELQKIKEEKERKNLSQKARFDVNLFRNITKIRWQHQSEPDIKGYVVNKKDVKPFSFKVEQMSKFFTANYLWDMIEEDW